MKNPFKRKKDEEDLSVVDDYKEAFTWASFWDEEVMGRIKKIHDFLQEHGILFFLLSPFQYKNRLITKIILIFFGVLVGIVPRTMNMVNSTKIRNNDSELAQAKQADAGPITVVPLSSSQSKKQHLLVFNIQGDTANGVPSTPNLFNVSLSANRGVTDGNHVKYKYTIVPVDSNDRLLVVYVDQRKQNDNTGIFNLKVKVKGQASMSNPLEIVLSNTQKTNGIFRDGKIDLAPLSDKILKEDGQSIDPSIKQAQSDLKSSLNVYKINEERLLAQHMTPVPSYDKLKAWVEKNSYLTNLTDKSTVADLTVFDERQMNMKRNDDQTMTAGIVYKGKAYTTDDASQADDDTDNDTDDNSDNNKIGDTGSQNNTVDQIKNTELGNLSKYITDTQQKLQTLNTSRITMYNNLKLLQNVLSTKLDPSTMGPEYTLK